VTDGERPEADLEAESVYRRVMAVVDPTNPDEVGFAIWTRNSLARTHEGRGDMDEAERLRQESYEIRRRVLGDDHPLVAGLVGQLGRFALRAGNIERADSLLQRVAEIYSVAYGVRSPPYATALLDVAEVRTAQSRLQEADSLIGIVLDVRGQRARQSVGYADALRLRAGVRASMGRAAEAEAMLQQALTTLQPLVSERSRPMRDVHNAFADLYESLGRVAEAGRHRERARPAGTGGGADASPGADRSP
jgi:tetratricopeptide (TPR) repeat protein